MNWSWTTHPLLLLACMLIGGGIGLVSTELAGALDLAGQAASALLEMAGLPLLVVATLFGLRNLVTLPHGGRRLGWLLLLVALCVWLSGLLGALAGVWLAPGQTLDAGERRAFGALVQQVGGETERTDMLLLAPPPPPGAAKLAGVLPDNVYAVLVRGDLAGIIWCTLVLGLPFALLPRERSQALVTQLEPIYRALEQLVEHITKLLPLLAFGMAAHVGAQLRWEAISLLGGLLSALLLSSGCIIALALGLVARWANIGIPRLLVEMKAPLLTALLAPTLVASIPSTIKALTDRLALSRGIVEVVVPVGTVWLAAGSALQAALITVFVTQLYGLPLGPGLLLWISVLAALAALVARPDSAAAGLAPAALVMLWLRIPSEAVLPVLLLADGLGRGLRQLTSLCCIAATCALLSSGLRQERPDWHTSEAPAASRPLQFNLTRAMAVLVLAGVLGAGLLSTLAGLGVGMRSVKPLPTSLLDGTAR